ncbi:hypothetical protein DFQ01_101192 [Paenibacillus cellulosilyticus]|uniref:Uncharacterized protein n=1 Tax=Paenibacillus cellulosilyticus TaxID=375489 RepID=A0A2V2Z3T0_9BACL|nr:hypothetical protein [Paenibacillus cellulosilyticus]PWW08470.1 hypothetical protein DFQ01_101192 [Paenibacillus cellulosilyticus]QKS48055.1 hypothetical protein HUB94_27595 [Paenibacillus cellulosilyticus]
MTTEIHVEKGTKQKKKMRRWVKWLLIIIITLVVLIIASVGAGYWYIKSISLDDIKSRHPETSGSVEVTTEPAKIPKVMEGAVDKAASLVGKEIEGQDALDIAAILLNSGLSLRDIRYLQGNATYDLTTEEKQHIRDLLLEKLTQDEIELLRSITLKYGKNLNILNPDYPIEWVGETDPEKIKEYEQKWKEMQAAKASGTTSNSGTQVKDVNSSANNSTATNTAETSDNTTTKSDTTNTNSASAQLDEQQAAKKKEIDAKYDSKFASLKSTCTAKSNKLLQSITAELNANPDISLSQLQTKFLGQLSDAESTCDSQFNQLQSQAQADYKAAGIPTSTMPNWKSEYDKAKSAARASGIAAIAKHMTGK